MRVPILERQVQENPVLLPTPTISPPIKDDFGKNMAEAIENLGKTGVELGGIILQHIQRQNYYKSEAKGKDAANKLALDQNDLLYSTEPREIYDPETGQTLTKISGIVNNLGFDATGSKLDYDQRFAVLRKNYTESIKDDPVALTQFNELANTLFKNGDEIVVKHEATEWHKGQNNIYASTAVNLINQAETAQTPKLLSDILDNIIKNSDSTANFNGWDTETIQKNKNKNIEDAVKKAVLGRLQATGSDIEAHDLLDKVKNRLPLESYDILDKAIDDRKTIFEKQIARNEAIDRFKNRSDVIKGIASGRIDLSDSDIAIKLAGNDTELGTAIKAVQEDKGNYMPQTIKNEAYQTYVKDIFASTSQEKIGAILVDALHARGNKEISQDKLNILVDAAINQAKILPVKEGDDIPEMTPQQIETLSGVKAILNNKNKQLNKDNMLFHFFKGIFGGKSPQDAHDEAVKQENIKNHSWLKTIPKNGKIYRDRVTGAKRRVYSDGTIEEVK